MPVRRRLLGAAAALLALGAVSVAATLTADAATPACGLSCLDVSSVYGTFLDIGSHQVDPSAGQPVILAPASNDNPGEDFGFGARDTVEAFYEGGVVGAAIDLRYSSFTAYEIAYTPFGVDSFLCVGVGATPGEGTRVTLQPCGLNARTVWIVDPNPTGGSGFSLISAATAASNVADPFVLSAPLPGGGAGLSTETLASLTTYPLLPVPHASVSVFPTQLWGSRFGVLP